MPTASTPPLAPPLAPPPKSPPTPLPSLPPTPQVRQVEHTSLTLVWEAAPEEDRVRGWRVLAQAAGATGFRPLVEDTKSVEPCARLTTLSPATWYEFKVCALNAAGASVASPATCARPPGAPSSLPFVHTNLPPAAPET